MTDWSLVLMLSYGVGGLAVAWTSTMVDLLTAAIAAPFVFVWATYTHGMIVTAAYERFNT